MNRLNAKSLGRFRAWPAEDVPKALRLLDEDAHLCGRKRLDGATLNFLVERLPSNYFKNRHRRELHFDRKGLDAAMGEAYKDLAGAVDRAAEHWLAMATSPQDDPQEDAKVFATSLRLENAVLWLIVGERVRAVNPGMESVFWKPQARPFSLMAL